MVRYANSAVGRVPTQIDFADYRPVSGVMMPFKRTYGWVSGREEYTLTEIKPNVPVDDAQFAKPPNTAFAGKITHPLTDNVSREKRLNSSRQGVLRKLLWGSSFGTC
jgi:hypothetical protein